MNPEVKGKWLTALRSGEYRQGKSVLRTLGNQYCCLGVLCDIAVKEGVIREPSEHGDAWNYDGTDYYLSPTVQDWAGLDETNPAVSTIGGGRDYLSNLNDDGSTFDEIADLIEQNL